MKEITRETAVRVLAAVDAGHFVPPDSELPAEARVAHVVRGLSIDLFEMRWSSAEVRAQSMRRFAVAQLGSEGIDSDVFQRRLALMNVRTIVPQVLRFAAAELTSDADGRSRLSELARRCERDPCYDSARAAADLVAQFDSRCGEAVASAASAASSTCGTEAIWIAADAVDMAALIGEKSDGGRDRVMAEFVENVVQILNSSGLNGGTPGCECLRTNRDLAPLSEKQRSRKLSQIAERCMSIEHEQHSDRKARAGGVLFKDSAGSPQAFLVQNKQGDEPFFVSCTKVDGRMHYMYSLTERGEDFLGVRGLTHIEQRDLARLVAESVQREIAQSRAAAAVDRWVDDDEHEIERGMSR